MPRYRPDVEARFWEKVKKSEECWEWQAHVNNKGYGHFRVSHPVRRMVFAHRYAWELLKGAIPDGLSVCHGCDNPRCVRPGSGHTFLGTHKENMQDSAAKLRINTTKLSADQIQEIRSLIRGHQTYGLTKELSEKFGVHRSTIRRAAKKIAFVRL